MADETYILLSKVLLALGVVAVLFALLFGRIRQRLARYRKRRCPKCWYDLSHTEGLRCSECGYTAKRERKLYKARRRWKTAMLGGLLLLGSYALNVTPAVKQRGWVAAVPTTVLILGMPMIEPSDAVGRYGESSWLQKTTTDHLTLDFLEDRVGAGDLWDWQRKLLVDRCLRGDAERVPPSWDWCDFYGWALDEVRTGYPDYTEWIERAEALVDLKITTRSRWPTGVPVYAQVKIQRWDTRISHYSIATPTSNCAEQFEASAGNIVISYTPARGWHDGLTRIGLCSDQTDALQYNVEIYTRRELFGRDDEKTLRRAFELTVPVAITADAMDELQPIESPELDSKLREWLDPVLADTRGSMTLWHKSITYPNDIDVDGLTFAFDVQLLRNGEPVARKAMWSEAKKLPWGSVTYLELYPDGSLWWPSLRTMVADEFEAATWEVLITDNQELALRNFDGDRYWAGELRLPVRVESE